MEENIRTCCRICLDVESSHVSILDDPNILLHIKSCLEINVSFNDNLPKDICVNCVSQLSAFYNFQQNARCSQYWLESSMQEKMKKTTETKAYVQPLPDSEYNSDSLLEFLNNTANIEEYLNNLGKEDIPSIVNMLEKTTEHVADTGKTNKQISPKHKESDKCINMDIDVLDSDIEIVNEILSKDSGPKYKIDSLKHIDRTTCFACKTKFDTIQKVYQHLSFCDNASRTCIHCNVLFDSKKDMKKHSLNHGWLTQMTCICGKQFPTKDLLLQHYNNCHEEQAATLGFYHRCKQCHMIFKDRVQLFKHAKVHLIKSEERICDICGHIFIGIEALSNHRQEVHKKSDNSLYRCKICNETSTNRKEIYFHVQQHNTKQVVSRHLCESCGHSFSTRSTLMRHSLLHKNGKKQKRAKTKRFFKTKTKDYHISELGELFMCEKCGQTVNKLDSHMCHC